MKYILSIVLYLIFSPVLAQSITPQIGGGIGLGFDGGISKGSAAPAAWTPMTPPGLVAWYKANNDSTNVYSDGACSIPQTTDGGSVLCWKDKSGNGFHLFVGINNAPTYQLAGLDGKPTVTFSRVGAQRLSTANGVTMGTGNAISGFAEMLFTSAANFDQAITYAGPSGASSSTGGTIFSIVNGSSTQFFGAKNNVNAGVISFGAFGTFGRFGFINDGTNNTSYFNNVAGTPTAGTNASISGGCISVGNGISSGCIASGTFFDGKLSEIIIYNQALSASDRASLDAYLAARW